MWLLFFVSSDNIIVNRLTNAAPIKNNVTKIKAACQYLIISIHSQTYFYCSIHFLHYCLVESSNVIFKTYTAGYNKKSQILHKRGICLFLYCYSFSLSLSTIDFFVRFLYAIAGIIVPIIANTGIAATRGRIEKL